MFSAIHRNYRVLKQVDFDKKFETLPQFVPEDCQVPNSIQVPSSPCIYSQNYNKKKNATSSYSLQNTPQQLSSQPQTPLSKMMAKADLSAKSSSTPLTTRLEGYHFFGPDFNPNQISGN